MTQSYWTQLSPGFPSARAHVRGRIAIIADRAHGIEAVGSQASPVAGLLTQKYGAIPSALVQVVPRAHDGCAAFPQDNPAGNGPRQIPSGPQVASNWHSESRPSQVAPGAWKSGAGRQAPMAPPPGQGDPPPQCLLAHSMVDSQRWLGWTEPTNAARQGGRLQIPAEPLRELPGIRDEAIARESSPDRQRRRRGRSARRRA